MNLTGFINTLTKFEKRFGLNKDDYYLTHGGALMLLGLKKTTDDCDVTISNKDKCDWFMKAGFPMKEVRPGVWCISVLHKVDVHNDDGTVKPEELMKTRGIWHTTPERILADKKVLNREKDQYWIKLLEDHINKKKIT